MFPMANTNHNTSSSFSGWLLGWFVKIGGAWPQLSFLLPLLITFAAPTVEKNLVCKTFNTEHTMGRGVETLFDQSMWSRSLTKNVVPSELSSDASSTTLVAMFSVDQDLRKKSSSLKKHAFWISGVSVVQADLPPTEWKKSIPSPSKQS